jgi:cytochrome c-type biogenesis protein CcmF
MNTGDTVLYFASALGIIAIVLLLLNQAPKKRFKAKTPIRRLLDVFSDIDMPLKWLLRVFGVLLIFDISLLSYFFYSSHFNPMYVWQFSSNDLPLVYKLSGVLAGQQGTLLFWGVVVGLSSLWLSETKKSTEFMKKVQVVVIVLSLFFIAMTLKESPFNTWTDQFEVDAIQYDVTVELVISSYEQQYGREWDYERNSWSDGNGLNPLLIDPWMAVHPPIIFIAYGLMAVPFALAVAYQYRSIQRAPKRVYTEWTKNVTSWCRVSWIFLTLGIAIGGFWAYKVLGWGGFWAWDPVETSSLVPWFLLTGALHALIEHKKDRSKYNVLAPLLVAWSFALVMYATLVTRSGFFESVHAFDAGSTGRYILYATAITAIVPLALAIIQVIKSKGGKESEEDVTFINQANMFYVTIILFIVFTFVSFWGITFPALSRLFSETKVGIEASFYNIWCYPVIIILMFLAGFCLSYRPQKKKESINELLLFLGIMVVIVVVEFILLYISRNLMDFGPIVWITGKSNLLFELILISESRTLMEYSSTVGLAGKPGFYSFISSISILSFIPPSVYLTYSAIERFRARHYTPKRRNLYKGVGILLIHFGAALIVVGSVYSYAIDEEYSVSLNAAEEGRMKIVTNSTGGETSYRIKLLKYEILREYKDVKDVEEEKEYQGMGVLEFYNDVHNGIRDLYQIHGVVGEVVQVEHNTYVKLVEGAEEVWVAVNPGEIPTGAHLTASNGTLVFDFPSSSLNRTFPILIMAPEYKVDKTETQETISTTQIVNVAVYDDNGKSEIARGAARSITYFNGNVDKVMIDRSLKQDVYVISSIAGNDIKLDLRIKPLINLLWIGIIFFTFGMIGVLLEDSIPKKVKAPKKRKKKNV